MINETTVVENNTEERNEVLEAIPRGFCWMEEIEQADESSMCKLARSEGVDESYVRRMINTATSLSPADISAMLGGDRVDSVAAIRRSVKAGKVTIKDNA